MATDANRYMMGVSADLLQPDLILPVQYFHPPKKLSPEHRLMMAIVDDAFRCVEKNRHPKNAQGRRAFREAKLWLLAEEPHWPFSFEQICAVLDLDADAVRQRLQLAPEEPTRLLPREKQMTTGRTAVSGNHAGGEDANEGFRMVAGARS